MKTKLYLATVIAVFSFLLSSRAAQPTPVASPETAVNAPEFKNPSDLKWDKILPDLGADSPEISILHVDPKMHATSLLIRTPKAIHVRKHCLRATANAARSAPAGSTSCLRRWFTKLGCPRTRSHSSPSMVPGISIGSKARRPRPI